MLHNAAADKAVSLCFDVETLPWFVLWKNTQAQEDGYCVGLEPAGSFPNLRSFERQQGRVRSLAAGESVSYRFDISVAQTADSVNLMLADVAAIQAGVPTVRTEPRADWSN